MKILVNTPCQNLLGGVANHYLGLRDFWTENVVYNTVGKRSKNGNGILWLPWDIMKFIFKLLFFCPDIVLLNPSLGKSALKRDSLFLQIACLFKFKVVVFFHGFNLEYAKKVNKEWVRDNLNKASLILVLASSFKEILQSWGVKTPITLTTTKVDDRLIEGFDIATKDYSTKNILFLARIEEAKGIYTALDSIKILQEKEKYIKFRVAGSGAELERAKQYAIDNCIKADFLGNISGNNLINEFSVANVYILPSHAEGMPTSVLEAMAFGIPIISRPVGGLCDFFENGKMGQLIESLDPQEYAEAIDVYINNPSIAKEVSEYNHKYAKGHFLASSVAKAIEDILKGK